MTTSSTTTALTGGWRRHWIVRCTTGDSLVIDRTEAMTVVDVNTGKFTGSSGNLEETVTKNNLEAAERLSVSCVCAISAALSSLTSLTWCLSRTDLVLRRLIECLGRDRTKHQVAG